MLAAIADASIHVSSGVRVEIVPFTPALAQAWLDKGRHNRAVVPNAVRFYSRVMSAGGWRVNGEPIIVNEHDKVINGQHRLLAVIDSNCTVPMLVVYGIADDAFDTIDTGRIRSGRDILSIHGVDDSMAMSAAATLLWKYERANGVMTAAVAHETPTNSELVDVLNRHPLLQASLPFAIGIKKLCGRGRAAFCHYIFACRDKVAADRFFDDLAKGENLRDGQAVYLLREALLANRQSKRKMAPTYQLALIIRAFNYERAGRITKNIRWRQRGPALEAFPTLE